MAIPPYAIAESLPGDSDIVAQHPFNARQFRDVVESWLSQIADPTTGYSKIPTDTTANLAAITQPIGGTRYDTTRKVLQVKTGVSTWEDVGMPQGTVAIFFQETAPAGWTKLTDAQIDGAIFEAVIGTTGGDYIAGTAVGSLLTSRLVTQANLPAVALNGNTTSTGGHTHSGNTDVQGSHNHGPAGGGNFITNRFPGGGGIQAGTGTSMIGDSTTALAGAHAHTVTLTSDGTHNHNVQVSTGGSSTPMDFAVKRMRVIVCVKD